ncbi:hypothetical protein [Bacillus phage SBSphiJ6]|nr:hypothetical protein [Bacillus phage SBSphiJ2]UPI13186.1 hypothetical protein [Bacillus phage SBSphiJ6]
MNNTNDPRSMFKAVRLPPKQEFPWEIDNKRRKSKRELTWLENPRYVRVEEFWSMPLFYTVDLEDFGTDNWSLYGCMAEDMSIYDDLAEYVEKYNKMKSNKQL